MSDNLEEEKRPDGGGKGKKKEAPPAPDKSTPDPLDPALVSWMWRLFRDDERADFVYVKQLIGPSNKIEGSVVKTIPFRAGKAPTHEEVVVLSNEMIEEMQDEADNHRKPRMFAIEAVNAKKGVGAFARRTYSTEPKKLKISSNGQPHGDTDDEDNPLYGYGGDKLLKRVETILADGRWHSEQQSQNFGGIAQLLTEENRELRAMVKTLMTEWLAMAKQKNDSDNNALDREVIRNRENLTLEMKRQGMTAVTTYLLPKLGEVTKQMLAAPPTTAPTDPAGPHADAVTLQKVINSLSAPEKDRIFGVWTDEGACTTAGILTDAQVRIIAGVNKGEMHPDWLNQLVPGQPSQVTPTQGLAAVDAADMKRLEPLMGILQRRRDEIAARASAVTTTATAKS